MATLVLSAVGSALGGPVGGAIGALIGQSFDRQLLGPATRGPRLGDLDVQTSTYGTQIPRIYGSMRIAGCVVWATDLVESEETNGAKGGPDVTYSYSVSLAVALSSRHAVRIGRIWADGQLLRGAEGDFKVPVVFRFYPGGEGQDVDPLIASIEGITNTPAYRGLALAVFEDLQLATYGNRIPFMTFEVVADEDALTLGAILADASDNAIEASCGNPVKGYAAYGRSIGDAVEPLVSAFDLKLFDDGETLRSPASSALVVTSDELGCSARDAQNAAIERLRKSPGSAASTLRLSYYDPDRDYQTGEARALASDMMGSEVQRQFPAVLSAADAKGIAQKILAQSWQGLDQLIIRLPPRYLGIEPGTVIDCAGVGGSWLVDKVMAESFVSVVELVRQGQAIGSVAADAGRAVSARDEVRSPVTLAILEVPDLSQSGSATPVLLVAASSPATGWSRETVAIKVAGMTKSAALSRKSILGVATSALGSGSPFLVDEQATVDVTLIDQQQWLTSCDDAALAAGGNLALLGREVLQFGDAVALGGGKFRLSRLLRGRAGTDWAMEDHRAGETFCLLDETRLAVFEVPASAMGAAISVADAFGAQASATFAGDWVRPLAPIDIEAAFDASGLSVSWTRRSRLGLAWLDGVDAPIGERAECYRVSLVGSLGRIDRTCDSPTLSLTAAELSALGSGNVLLEVQQVGDWAVSRPATTTINL